MSHSLNGNCWDTNLVYGCTVNGCVEGVMCDVCHAHDEPRGECSACEDCEEC